MQISKYKSQYSLFVQSSNFFEKFVQKDILSRIFAFLPPNAVLNLRLVNKKFREINKENFDAYLQNFVLPRVLKTFKDIFPSQIEIEYNPNLILILGKLEKFFLFSGYKTQLNELLHSIENTNGPLKKMIPTQNFPKNPNDKTELMKAIESNNIKLIDQLLKKNVNLEERDCKGQTALFYALVPQNVSILKKLCEKGANIHVTIKQAEENESKTCLLDMACYHNNYEAIKYLIDDRGMSAVDINSPDCPLMWLFLKSLALDEKKIEIIDFFLKKGKDLYFFERNKASLLSSLCHDGELDTFKEIISRWPPKNKDIYTTFLSIAMTNYEIDQTPMMLFLLQKGAELTKRTKLQTPVLSIFGTNQAEKYLPLLFKKGLKPLDLIQEDDFRVLDRCANSETVQPLILAVNQIKKELKGNANVKKQKLIEILESKVRRKDEFLRPIAFALGSGNLDNVKFLLQQGCRLNEPSSIMPAMHLSKANPQILQLLLEKGEDVDSLDKEGDTPLLVACKEEMEDAIALFFVERSKNLNLATREFKQTALHFACQSLEMLSVVNKLISRGADIEALDFEQRTPIFHAIEKGNANACLSLILKKACLDLRDSGGCNLLHWATISNEQVLKIIIQALEKKGLLVTSINVKEKNLGITPIFNLIINGKLNQIKLLVNKGADINILDNKGRNILYYCAMHGREDILKYFIVHKDFKAPEKYLEQNDPLTVAIRWDRVEIVKILLPKDNISSLEAAFSYAAFCGAIASLEYLLELETLILEKQSIVWKKAFHQWRNELEMLENSNEKYQLIDIDIGLGGEKKIVDRSFLKEFVKNTKPQPEKAFLVNHANNEGETPLYLAVAKGRVDCVILLLEKGANIRAKTKSGVTILSKAIEQEHYNIVRLLMEANIEVLEDSYLESKNELIKAILKNCTKIYSDKNSIEKIQTIKKLIALLPEPNCTEKSTDIKKNDKKLKTIESIMIDYEQKQKKELEVPKNILSEIPKEVESKQKIDLMQKQIFELFEVIKRKDAEIYRNNKTEIELNKTIKSLEKSIKKLNKSSGNFLIKSSEPKTSEISSLSLPLFSSEIKNNSLETIKKEVENRCNIIDKINIEFIYFKNTANKIYKLLCNGDKNRKDVELILTTLGFEEDRVVGSHATWARGERNITVATHSGEENDLKLIKNVWNEVIVWFDEMRDNITK